MDELPGRTFDVGIAEQHAVTFSAGLASQGLIPFCNIYSSFAQRAYDQIIHDVALQKLPVVFCFDRGGLVGSDGPTHHGVFDLAYMRSIPNLTVAAPMNEHEMRHMMYTAQTGKYGAFSIRYPRGRGVINHWRNQPEEIIPGTSRRLSEGSDLAILSIGHIGNFATEAVKRLKKEGIEVCHVDMRWVKPLDEEELHRIFQQHKHILTVEDGTVLGGFGSAIVEFMAHHQYNAYVKVLGVPDQFVGQGTQQELWRDCGIDAEGIFLSALNQLKKHRLSKAI